MKFITLLFVNIINLLFFFVFAQQQTTQQTTNTQKVEWATAWLFANITEFILKFLLAILVTIILIIIFKYISSAIKKNIISHSMAEDDDSIVKTASLISDIVFYALVIFALFIWLQITWLDLWFFLWGFSIWIWFAFREILWNMFAWIMILSTKEFRIWDMIQIYDSNSSWRIQHFGTIEKITIRYTVIRTLAKRRIIIPNLTLVTSAIITFTSEDVIRLETSVTVHYETDIDKAEKIIIKAINKLPFVVEKKKTDVLVSQLWDDWIILTARFHIDPNVTRARVVAISKANQAILKALTENNIVIAYPHTVVTVDKNDKNLLSSLLFIKKK